MARLTSELIVSLVDRVTGPARRLSQTVNQMPQRLAAAQALNTRRMDEMRGQFFGAAAGAYALAHAIKAPITAAMGFESAMADVKKVVDFETPAGLKQFERDIVSMSQRMSMTAVELTEIVAAAGQAGIARDDLLRFTEQAAKVGTAFDISADQAGEAMAKMMTGLGLTVDDVGLLADAMNHLSNTQAASASDILEVVRRVGAMGKQFGFSATEVSAFGSAMVAAGAAPEVASTSFLNMGKALTKGTSATKRQQEAMKLLGLEAEDVARRMQEDAAGTTVEVMERMAALPEHMRAAVSSDLFGDEARALGPLLTNLDLVRESLGLVADETQYAGSAAEEYAARANTSEGALKRFRNNITAVAIAIGDALLPPLNQLMSTLTPTIQRVADLAGRFPRLTSTVVLGAAGLIGLRIAAIGAQFSLGLLKGAVLMVVRPMALATAATGRFVAALVAGTVARFTAAVRAMRAAVVGFAVHSAVAGLPATLGKMGAGFVGLLNPIRLVKAALGGLKVALVSTGIGAIVVALGAGGAWIMQNWEGVKAAFQSFGQSFKAALGPVRPALEPVLNALSGLWDWITKVTGPLDSSTWVQFGQTLGNAVGGAVRYVVEVFKQFQQWFRDAIDAVVGVIPDWIKEKMGIEVTAEPLSADEMESQARDRAEKAKDAAVPGRFMQREDVQERRQAAYDAEYARAMEELRAENERLAEAQNAVAAQATDVEVPDLIFSEPAPPAVTPEPVSMPPELAAGPSLDADQANANLGARLAEVEGGLQMQGRVIIDMTDLDLAAQRIASLTAALAGLGTATRAAADRAASALDRSRATNLQDRPAF